MDVLMFKFFSGLISNWIKPIDLTHILLGPLNQTFIEQCLCASPGEGSVLVMHMRPESCLPESPSLERGAHRVSVTCPDEP